MSFDARYALNQTNYPATHSHGWSRQVFQWHLQLKGLKRLEISLELLVEFFFEGWKCCKRCNFFLVFAHGVASLRVTRQLWCIFSGVHWQDVCSFTGDEACRGVIHQDWPLTDKREPGRFSGALIRLFLICVFFFFLREIGSISFSFFPSWHHGQNLRENPSNDGCEEQLQH